MYGMSTHLLALKMRKFLTSNTGGLYHEKSGDHAYTMCTIHAFEDVIAAVDKFPV